MRLLHAVMSLAFVCLLTVPVEAADVRDIVGITHIGGYYSFQSWPVANDGVSKRDYLNEGAIEIQNTGTKVIKVWFHPQANAWYHFTANPGFPAWTSIPPSNRLVTIAQSVQFSELFNRPFKTFVMNVMSNVPINGANGTEDLPKFGGYASMWDGLTSAELTTEYNAMYNLSIHLLDTYAGTGKTFILQNWEGDNMLMEGSVSPVPSSRVTAMIQWTNKRQDAVRDARAARPNAGAQVLYAAEVNKVWDAHQDPNYVGMVNSVIPYTYCDLYSYSAWDVNEDVENRLWRTLDLLANKAPDSALFGNRNIYIGEYGATDQQPDWQPQLTIARRITEIALGWGVRYALFWQIYCNGPVDPNHSYEDRPTNEEMVGFWLRRPSGTYNATYSYFVSLFQRAVHLVQLRAANPYWVCADEDQARRVVVNRSVPQKWETHAVIDLNGGQLMPGDAVNVISHTGYYFCAEGNGGGAVNANRTSAGPWEQFTILRASGSGSIGSGAAVAFRAGTNQYFRAEGGGGPSSLLNANAAAIGSWETFLYSEQ